MYPVLLVVFLQKKSDKVSFFCLITLNNIQMILSRTCRQWRCEASLTETDEYATNLQLRCHITLPPNRYIVIQNNDKVIRKPAIKYVAGLKKINI